MSDKLLGYILMLSALVISVVVTLYSMKEYGAIGETRILRFPEVGSLAVEDPVRMDGALVGQISGFEHDDSGRVVVQVHSAKPIPIRTSSRVAVKVKGVMGERFIEIGMGNINDPLIGKGAIIDGIFEMGPSEAIAYMDALEDKIIELKEIMLWLRDGRDDGKRPFVVAFNDIANIVDTLVLKLLVGVGGMEIGLGKGLDTVAVIAEKAIKLTTDVGAKAPELIEDLSKLIVKVDGFVTKVDTILARIEPAVEKIDKSKFLWGDDVEKLRKNLAVIKQYADELRNEGLPLTVRVKVF